MCSRGDTDEYRYSRQQNRGCGLPMWIDPPAGQPPQKNRGRRAPAPWPGMEQARAKESSHQLGPEWRTTGRRRRGSIGVGFLVRLSLHRNCPAARCLMCPGAAMKSHRRRLPTCPDRSGGSDRCKRGTLHPRFSLASCKLGTSASKFACWP